MGPIVGQDGADSVRYRLDEVQQEVDLDTPNCLLMQVGEGELRGPIDGDEEVEPALRSTHLGDVDVEVTDRMGLEPAPYALLSSTSGSHEMPCRCRQHCNDERVRCGLVA